MQMKCISLSAFTSRKDGIGGVIYVSGLTLFGLFVIMYHKDKLIGFSGLTQTVHSLNCDGVSLPHSKHSCLVSCLCHK